MISLAAWRFAILGPEGLFLAAHWSVRRYAQPLLLSGGLVGTSASVAPAQTVGDPVPHPLGSVVARSTIAFPGAIQVVALANGRVLVADPANLVVRLLDSTLKELK